MYTIYTQGQNHIFKFQSTTNENFFFFFFALTFKSYVNTNKVNIIEIGFTIKIKKLKRGGRFILSTTLHDPTCIYCIYKGHL